MLTVYRMLARRVMHLVETNRTVSVFPIPSYAASRCFARRVSAYCYIVAQI